MNSIEGKRNIAKIVLVISVMLLVVFSLNLFFPGFFGGSQEKESSSQVKDLEAEYEEIKMKYDIYQEQIVAAEKNTMEINQSITKIGSYADNNVPKYAIGAGFSIIAGLWLSTIILYFKISKDLFKE